MMETGGKVDGVCGFRRGREGRCWMARRSLGHAGCGFMHLLCMSVLATHIATFFFVPDLPVDRACPLAHSFAAIRLLTFLLAASLPACLPVA